MSVQGANDTIRNVTQEFLLGLQDNFPSTIPTVNRTGDKLSYVVTNGDHDTPIADQCCFCSTTLDTDTDRCHNALQATQYSSFVSAGGHLKQNNPSATSCDSGTECCGEGDGSCKTRAPETVRMEDVMSSLCYSCRRIFHGLHTTEGVPGSLVDKVRTQVRRNKMKNEISDFLL